MNPYALIAISVLAIALAGGSFKFGVDYARGQEARAEQLVLRTREESRLGAADAIASQKKQTTIIKQQLETVTREVEIYRDCRNTPAALGLLNDALTNRSGEPAGASELPGADAPDR